MITPIVAICDDCGKESDQVYDSPWRDNKVRCEDCFLVSEGYDIDQINEWCAYIASNIRQFLAETAEQRATKRHAPDQD